MARHFSRGLSILEAVVIIPLGLFISIALFDLATVGFVKVMLEFGASAIAREAVANPAIKADTTQAGCTANPGACQSFTGHLSSAMQAGDRYVRWAAAPSTETSRRTLVPMQMFHPNHFAGNSWNTTGIAMMGADMAIVRPGEGMLMLEEPATNTWGWVDHSLRRFGSGPGQGWPNPGERWDDLLKRLPVSAVICARVETFVLGSFTVCGRQHAYYLGARSANAAPGGPVCSNAVCETGETCATCPQDCGACPAGCGDGVCSGSETCETCSTDCGVCACGDGVCQQNGGGETSFSCCADCGSAGDGVCCSSENCASAPVDCFCPLNTMCNPLSGQCECVPNCPPDYCGYDGCGGYCQCPVGKACVGNTCLHPPGFCGDGTVDPDEQCETTSDCGIGTGICVLCRCEAIPAPRKPEPGGVPPVGSDGSAFEGQGQLPQN